MRIVSLLPSATEMICLLGLQESLVGVSHECDFPPSVAELPRVTASQITVQASSKLIDLQVREMVRSNQPLFELDHAVLESLQPDLIVTQALCDVCAISPAQVSAIAARLTSCPTIVELNPTTVSQVLDGLLTIGQAAGVPDTARDTIRQLEQRIAAVQNRSQRLTHRPSVAMLEWLEPLFCAGHWNPELVALAGGEEMFGRAGHKSQQLEWNDLRSVDPDVLIIACCGLSIDRTLEDLPQLVSLPGFGRLKSIDQGRVYLNDGSSYFNRPGPRLVDSLEILAHALHPDVHPLPDTLEPAVRMKRN